MLVGTGVLDGVGVSDGWIGVSLGTWVGTVVSVDGNVGVSVGVSVGAGVSVGMGVGVGKCRFRRMRFSAYPPDVLVI